MQKLFTAIAVLAMFIGGQLFSQTVFYTEDFANGTAQNPWSAGYNGNNMEVEFLSGNPSNDSWVGKLGNDLSGGNVGQSYSGDPSWTDFYYEAWVWIPLNEGTYYGLEFRVGADTNSFGYQFLARFNTASSDRSLRFRARPSSGFPTTIRQWLDAEIPGGIPTTDGWHKMAVRAIGNQFWFYFDGQELPGAPYTDNTYSSGAIGVYVWDFVLSPIYLYIDDIIVMDGTTAIGDADAPALSDYQLHQNFPNPFNPSTTISFDLSKREIVQLSVFNNLGQKIRTLAAGAFTPGNHQVQWDGRDDLMQAVPAGLYYYRLQAGSYQTSRKMLLVK